jgi:hypothetical protein
VPLLGSGPVLVDGNLGRRSLLSSGPRTPCLDGLTSFVVRKGCSRQVPPLGRLSPRSLRARGSMIAATL